MRTCQWHIHRGCSQAADLRGYSHESLIYCTPYVTEDNLTDSSSVKSDAIAAALFCWRRRHIASQGPQVAGGLVHQASVLCWRGLAKQSCLQVLLFSLFPLLGIGRLSFTDSLRNSRVAGNVHVARGKREPLAEGRWRRCKLHAFPNSQSIKKCHVLHPSSTQRNLFHPSNQRAAANSRARQQKMPSGIRTVGWSTRHINTMRARR